MLRVQTCEDPDTLVLGVDGPIHGGQVRQLCALLRAAVTGTVARRIVLDLQALVDPGIEAVDAIARLQLSAGRLGRRLELCHPPPGFEDLIALVGLDQVLSCVPGSGVGVRGEAEQREQPRGVEEGVEPDDPSG
jgi:anti-anti-sigma regulatory factor